MNCPGSAPISAELGRKIVSLLARQRLVILGITGPPGAGKTTLAQAVVGYACNSGIPAAHVAMDGFHLADVELDRLGRRDRKGAIDTFDGHGYVALLQRIRSRPTHTVYAPVFDRLIEQPVAAGVAVPPDTRLVVTEGNYLVDDAQPWASVREVLTQVWYLEVPRQERRRRLVGRHVQFGKEPDAAEAWVRTVDEPNAERIAGGRDRADLCLGLTDSGEWKVL